MPTTRVVFFREDDGSSPLLRGLDALPERARDKCTERIERLREHGHVLRLPEADYLREGIHELRVKDERINYRILYFFHGREAVVLSHGIIKQAAVVPPREIGERSRANGHSSETRSATPWRSADA